MNGRSRPAARAGRDHLVGHVISFSGRSEPAKGLVDVDVPEHGVLDLVPLEFRVGVDLNSSELPPSGRSAEDCAGSRCSTSRPSSRSGAGHKGKPKIPVVVAFPELVLFRKTDDLRESAQMWGVTESLMAS